MSSAGEGLSRPLPEQVRLNVVDLAAQVLGSMPGAAIPPPLRGIAKFDPRKRARLGSAPIAAQLENDKEFREAVAESVAAGWPELITSLAEGNVPPAADPVLVAAAAYLTRPPGWAEMVESARADLERSVAAAEGSEREEVVSRLREQLAALKTTAKEEAERLREQLKAARAENSDLRRKLHEARERTQGRGAPRRGDDARRRGRQGRRLGRGHRGRVRAAAAARAPGRRREAARSLAQGRPRGPEHRGRPRQSAARRAAGRLGGTAQELALPTTISKPADSVAAVTGERPGVRGVPARALADDDPQLLDQLLALPQVHLIIDGYNVTKSGYGTLTLADQRNRLMTGLGGLVAQTRVEVTVVFDGAELNSPVQVVAPRGVRVLFSAPGEIADDLIRQLVRAEPPGRAIAVVSSDREVAESVRRMGARPVPSGLLLRRLGRA